LGEYEFNYDNSNSRNYQDKKAVKKLQKVSSKETLKLKFKDADGKKINRDSRNIKYSYSLSDRGTRILTADNALAIKALKDEAEYHLANRQIMRDLNKIYDQAQEIGKKITRRR
jgi:hypothetical protein